MFIIPRNLCHNPMERMQYSPPLCGWDSWQIWEAVCPKTQSQQITKSDDESILSNSTNCCTTTVQIHSAHCRSLPSAYLAFVAQASLPWPWGPNLLPHPASCILLYLHLFVPVAPEALTSSDLQTFPSISHSSVTSLGKHFLSSR